MKQNPPRFDGYQPAQADFDASRTGLITPFQKIDIDVSVAPTLATAIYTVAGDFIYQDLDPLLSNGNVTIEFNRQQDADNGPIYLVPGLALPTVFKGFRLNWAVQPAKKVRLLYSTGSRIIPAAASIASIGSIATPVGIQGPRTIPNGPVLADLPALTRDIGIVAGANYASATGIAALGTSQVFAPGSNTNGAIVWGAMASSQAAAQQILTLLAKASAPATIADGVGLYAVVAPAAGGMAFGQYARIGRYIAPGLGLYWFAQSLETAAMRVTDYTLL